MAKAQSGALEGVRIIDLTDERGIYGVKLMADLGADVVRPEPLGGDPLRRRGPLSKSGTSLWHAFFASNRRFFALDLDADAAALQALVEAADAVVFSRDGFGVDAVDIQLARERNPQLVAVECSSFGDTGPWRDYLAPDLVAGALGGSVATTGDADTPPLKGFGELNFMVSGCYVAIATLAALRHARDAGIGQNVDVPVHQCIASCLDHVLMWYWYNPAMPAATAKALPRRGSLHWSNAYRVMQAIGGSIMVTPTPDLDAQFVWLIEEGVADDLFDPKYSEPETRAAFVPRMMEIIEAWVATKDVAAFFFEAQERHAPYGWVLPIEAVAANPQLEARDWWRTYSTESETFRGPGAPYQFSATPWSMDATGGVAAATEDVLGDIGWVSKS